MTDLTFTKAGGEYVSQFQLTKPNAQIHLEFSTDRNSVALRQSLTGANYYGFDYELLSQAYDKVVHGGVVGGYIQVASLTMPTVAKYAE